MENEIQSKDYSSSICPNVGITSTPSSSNTTTSSGGSSVDSSTVSSSKVNISFDSTDGADTRNTVTLTMKSLAALLSTQSILSIDSMVSLSQVDSSSTIYVSSTAGFSYKTEEIRGNANPEYVTLKKKTSSQQGAHSRKPHQAKRVVTNISNTIDDEPTEKRRRLYAGEFTEEDANVLFQLVQSSSNVIHWDDIASLFNEKTARYLVEGKSFTTTQVKNAYRNKILRSSTGTLDAVHVTSSSNVDISAMTTPSTSSTSSVSGFRVSSNSSSDVASNEYASNNFKFSYEEIRATSIDNAKKAQEWTTPEVDILLRFRPGGELHHEVLQDGANKFISFKKLSVRYNYYARLAKLADSTAVVSLRTPDAIKNKVKYLRDRGTCWNTES
jgi:hypothetical protein